MQKEEGIVKIPSHHSVDETVDKLKTILQSKGVTLFAVVDHSGEAEKVGMKMPPTKLLIFGSPKAGTPLMLAAPSVAIDLPLKILVAEDAQGKAWISYNSPELPERAARLAPGPPAEYRRRAGAGGCGRGVRSRPREGSPFEPSLSRRLLVILAGGLVAVREPETVVLNDRPVSFSLGTPL